MNYVKRELSDEEIKADVMYRLIRKHRWGAAYLPVDALINWLGKHVRKDGKRVGKCLRELVKEGYLLAHKEGAAISLNPALSKEIQEYIRRVLKS